MGSHNSSNYGEDDGLYHGGAENDYFYDNSQHDGHAVSDCDRDGMYQVSDDGFNVMEQPASSSI